MKITEIVFEDAPNPITKPTGGQINKIEQGPNNTKVATVVGADGITRKVPIGPTSVSTVNGNQVALQMPSATNPTNVAPGTQVTLIPPNQTGTTPTTTSAVAEKSDGGKFADYSDEELVKLARKEGIPDTIIDWDGYALLNREKIKKELSKTIGDDATDSLIADISYDPDQLDHLQNIQSIAELKRLSGIA